MRYVALPNLFISQAAGVVEVEGSQDVAHQEVEEDSVSLMFQTIFS